ncbi:MAG TPA: ribonuclease P protein component 1 [archaeon]|nr:ribonuclease P protein component 1 [archaeon]
MVTPKDLVMHELIGLEVKLVVCSNKQLEGLSGTVTDESRNMLTIETPKGEKSLAKEDCTFSFHIPSGEWVKVDGSLLVARPEDRIKKRLRRW